MDQTSLVREQIDGGEKLIRKLIGLGFELSAGVWAKIEDDGRDYLYLVTPRVENADPRPAYAEVSAAQEALENAGLHGMEQIDQFGIKLIPPTHSLAEAVLDRYAKYPGPIATWFNGSRFGSTSVEGVYIYPPSLFRVAQPATP